MRATGSERQGWAKMRVMCRAATAIIVLSSVFGTIANAQGSVQACPNAASCAQVTVGSDIGPLGGTVNVPLTFKQGPTNAQAGGIDEIAAIAFTLNIGSNLTLADCSVNADTG